jgi:hypothetical protein
MPRPPTLASAALVPAALLVLYWCPMPFSAISSIVILAFAAARFSVEGARQRGNIPRPADSP